MGELRGRSSKGTPPPRDELVNEETPADRIPAAKERLPIVNTPSSVNKKPSLTQRLMLNLDERVSVKLLLRIWGPRLEFIVRLMLVATFMDDSLRMAMRPTAYLGRSNGFAIMSGIGFLVQVLGSICLIALLQVDATTLALIGWTIVQPLLHSQVLNAELTSESLSLIGGLLMLRVHLLAKQQQQQATSTCERKNPSNRKTPTFSSKRALVLTQLVGRLLLPTAYLYHAGRFLFSAYILDETNNLAAYVSSLSVFVVNSAMLVALVIGSMLVATGLKSRTIALWLALLNLCFVFYQHPFFRFLSLGKGGEWKVDEDTMWMPSVSLPTGVTPFDLDPWQIYDLHRYYFFLGLSTSGALLLLAQFGPGEIAMQNDETLLPVFARAHD